MAFLAELKSLGFCWPSLSPKVLWISSARFQPAFHLCYLAEQLQSFRDWNVQIIVMPLDPEAFLNGRLKAGSC